MGTQTQIISSSAALDALQKKLQGLKDRADSLHVTDQETDRLAKLLKADLESYIKAVKFQTGPDIEIAKEKLRDLQAQEKMFLAPAQEILAVSEQKRKDYEREEFRRTELERQQKQDELNRQQRIKADAEKREAEKLAVETRKKRVAEIKYMLSTGAMGKREAARVLKEIGADEEAAIQQAAIRAEETAAAAPVVEVKPNIPAVAGTVSRQNWKFRFVDPTRIPRSYMMPDEVKIGQMVRATKDKKSAEGICPGIEVYTE